MLRWTGRVKIRVRVREGVRGGVRFGRGSVDKIGRVRFVIYAYILHRLVGLYRGL